MSTFGTVVHEVVETLKTLGSGLRLKGKTDFLGGWSDDSLSKLDAIKCDEPAYRTPGHRSYNRALRH